MLTPEEAEELEQALVALEMLESEGLYPFLQAAWPIIEPRNPFVPGKHIEAICEHLEAVHRGEIRNLLINIPPRHAKSTIVSVGYPAWVWSKDPGHKFLYGSHAFSLAKRDSIKCRMLVKSKWFRETFKIKWDLKEDQNEKMRFDNTEQGYRLATSVGGSIIGEGGDTLVIDDPHSPQSVRSEVQRAAALSWADESFFTRINNPKTVSKIVIMQRLDEKDLSRHLLEQGDWEHLMLPAEFEPERKCSTSIGWEDPRTEAGEALWPERFPREEIQRMAKNMGSMAAAGQLQQRPSPREGAIFKRKDLKFYTVLPTLEFYGLSVDLPFDEGSENSFAVFQLWGKKGADKYLIDQTRAQCNFKVQIDMIKAMVGKHPTINAKWVEKKANGAALITTLQNLIPGLIPVEPRGSKVLRAESVSPQFESGNIHLPDPTIAPWVGDYIEELVTFPNAEHDDQVDATTQAISKMSEGLNFDWMPVSLTGTSKWLR